MSYFRIPVHFLSKVSLNKTRLGTRFSFLQNQGVKGLCGFLVTMGVIWQTSNHVSLVYSRTNSLPYHLFLNLKQMTPKRGHYTCFDSPWYGARVIKKVVGIEGDILSYDDEGNLWVKTLGAGLPNAPVSLKIGKYKKESKDGRLLNPIKPGVIPKGMVFVVGDHERSFDSRYEELGLIPEKDLQGRLVALV